MMAMCRAPEVQVLLRWQYGRTMKAPLVCVRRLQAGRALRRFRVGAGDADRRRQPHVLHLPGQWPQLQRGHPCARDSRPLHCGDHVSASTSLHRQMHMRMMKGVLLKCPAHCMWQPESVKAAAGS